VVQSIANGNRQKQIRAPSFGARLGRISKLQRLDSSVEGASAFDNPLDRPPLISEHLEKRGLFCGRPD
jgi:hypothetical protein